MRFEWRRGVSLTRRQQIHPWEPESDIARLSSIYLPNSLTQFAMSFSNLFFEIQHELSRWIIEVVQALVPIASRRPGHIFGDRQCQIENRHP
jgi:hypothetical protein